MPSVLEHIYKPRGSAVDLLRCKDDEVLYSGPAGTGKSRACLEKLNLIAVANAGMRGLIVRKTASSLGSTALVTWREYVIKEALDNNDVMYYGGSDAEPPQYRYRNGSRIMIGGMDRATKIMSSEYDIIYVQEAIELTEGDWEALISRLRHGSVSFQQIIGDTNPDVETHWLRTRNAAKYLTVIEARHEDNPLLYDDEGNLTDVGASYISKLDRLTGVRYQRLRKGLWVAAEGIIYEDWNPAVHLIAPFEIPHDWQRYISVDFGYTHPFVCQWWAEDNDGRLYLYREHYMTKRLVEDHARIIKKFLEHEPEPRLVICDHDAEDRATLERHIGLGTVPAVKTVKDGLEAVAGRLRMQDDGKPRLYIMRNCTVHRDQELVDVSKPTCTADEITGYIWSDKKQDTPVKIEDDGCDAMRYVVAECDLGARPNVRWL